MNMHIPTPTEAASIQRCLAFRALISRKAAALARSKLPAPRPLPKPRPALMFGLPDWYFGGEPSPDMTFRPPPGGIVTLHYIQEAVARHFGVTRHDLVCQRRTARIVQPRQIAMYLAAHLTVKSMPAIGRQFGSRDHTTILHGVRKIERMIREDRDTAHDIATLSHAITGIQQ